MRTKEHRADHIINRGDAALLVLSGGGLLLIFSPLFCVFFSGHDALQALPVKWDDHETGLRL